MVRLRSGGARQVAYRCGTEGSEHVYDRVTASVMVLVDDHEIAANCWRVMEVAAPLVRYPESGGVYEIDVPGLVPDRLDPLGRFGTRFPVSYTHLTLPTKA